MVKNAGSKNKRGRLMKNMKSPNSGLIAIAILLGIMMCQYIYICSYRINHASGEKALHIASYVSLCVAVS